MSGVQNLLLENLAKTFPGVKISLWALLDRPSLSRNRIVMEVKHQVFVSSTYRDLVEERKEVIHALLELDCIPAGMELFPATDEDAWSLIKEVIDGCDYYVLILAGKYGSTNKEGLGYTEMEYNYAVETGKPIICFVHEDIDSLPGGKLESTDAAKEKLSAFHEKAKERHCKFWKSAADLGGKVSRSMIQLKRKHPSDGWVPGRYAADQRMLAEMERMRTQIAELELERITGGIAPPPNFEKLAHGDDLLKDSFDLRTEPGGARKEFKLSVSWDKLFKYCGPSLAGECSESEMEEKMRLAFYHSIPQDIFKYNEFSNIELKYVTSDSIKMQFQALGLIQHGAKKRAIADKNTYWRLTPFGERHLIQISARRRKPALPSNNPDTSED